MTRRRAARIVGGWATDLRLTAPPPEPRPTQAERIRAKAESPSLLERAERLAELAWRAAVALGEAVLDWGPVVIATCACAGLVLWIALDGGRGHRDGGLGNEKPSAACLRYSKREADLESRYFRASARYMAPAGTEADYRESDRLYSALQEATDLADVECPYGYSYGGSP